MKADWGRIATHDSEIEVFNKIGHSLLAHFWRVKPFAGLCRSYNSKNNLVPSIYIYIYDRLCSPGSSFIHDLIS